MILSNIAIWCFVHFFARHEVRGVTIIESIRMTWC